MVDFSTLFACALAAVAVVFALPASSDAALVGYWNFDEGSGTLAADFSPNNNDGTFVHGGVTPMSWTTGHTGGAGDFALVNTGWTSYVGVPDSASFNSITTDFTIALWVRETFAGTYPYILYTTNGSGRRWFFQGPNQNGDQTYVWSDVDTNWQEGLGYIIPDDLWTHYAFTYSGGQLTRYINGLAFGSAIAIGSNFPDFTDSLRIGGSAYGPSGAFSSFEGYIDDVVFFNTVEDIASIMDGTHPEMNAEPAAASTPEPSTLMLLSAGLLTMLASARRRK